MQPFTTTYPAGRRWLPVLVVPVFVALWLVTDLGGSWFLALAVAFAAFNLAAGLRARLEVDGAGMLRVRGVLPGSERTLDLSQLTSARTTEHMFHSSGRAAAGGDVSQVLELGDAAGRTLRLDPRVWSRGDLVVEAVEQAAQARGVPIEGAEMFGMRQPSRAAGPAAPPGPAPAVPVQRLVVRPRGSVRAVALWFAFVGGLLVLGFATIGGLVLGVGLAAAGIEVGAYVPLLLGVAGLAVVVAVALSAIGARVTLEPDGLLSVRSLTPRARRVRLADLARVEADPGTFVQAGTLYERTTRVTLTERSGARVKLMAQAWNDLPVLMPALAAWAERAGAQMDERTRDFLLLGRKPAPTGTRPTSR